ncbi:MAG: response regulator [Chloroflexi bacterium]|nr:response regulator [Chloroflexota bacterium]MBU1751943.1 response regulator [Chloroflexota bacterium]
MSQPQSPAANAIQILIVDDVNETRESLSKLLYFEKDIQVIGTALNGREAIEAVKELEPDIVLMDINMPDMDGIKAAEIITAQAPHVQIIMMSVQGEADYLRRSMLAGARDFLIKPFSGDDLVNTIHRVYEMGATRRVAAPAPAAATAATPVVPAPGRQGGQIIALFSPQGGIGCTTLATNLAIAAKTNSNKRVALVDCNLQFGDVGIFLNMQSGKTIVDLVTMIDDLDAELVEDMLLPHSSGVRVLLAPLRPEMADLVTADHLRRILGTLRQSYDLIFVDTWPFLHEITLTVMDMCDRLLLVLSPEIPPVKNAKLFFEVMEAMQYPADRVMLVLNRVDSRGGISPRDIEMSIQHPLSAQIVADWRLATYAVNHGVPFVISHRESALARSVTELAYLFLVEPAVPEPASPEAPAAEAARPGLRWFNRA